MLCDGDFILTANNGDIVISGNIIFKDSTFTNSSERNKKQEKIVSKTHNNKAAEGFSHTVNAVNGDIILQEGATIFSGRGQHAPDETLTSLSGNYEGSAGGDGGSSF